MTVASIPCFSSNACSPALLPSTHIGEVGGVSGTMLCWVLIIIAICSWQSILFIFQGLIVKSEKLNKGRMTKPDHIWFAHNTALFILTDTVSVSQNVLPGLIHFKLYILKNVLQSFQLTDLWVYTKRQMKRAEIIIRWPRPLTNFHQSLFLAHNMYILLYLSLYIYLYIRTHTCMYTNYTMGADCPLSSCCSQQRHTSLCRKALRCAGDSMLGDDKPP